MSGPTLGCQIAPNYDNEQWLYTSSDDSVETDSIAQEEVVEVVPDLHQAETRRDVCTNAPPTRPSTLRTRSSRREAQQLEPVGFWHWSMVCAILEGWKGSAH
jgi:hypothetical protein